MSLASFGKQRVTELCNEHGHAYLDIYVAREFAVASNQPETDVLSIIRRQETIYQHEETGKGKWQRAKERACMSLAHGWETESLASNTEAIARLEFATAYGLMARRDMKVSSVPRS